MFGDGPGQFAGPTGIAIGPRGTIYVLDTLNNRVQAFSPSFRHLASWGRARDAAPGDFSEPMGIAVDRAGNVYVADTDNHRIERFTPDGRLLAVQERYGSGTGELDGPRGIAIGVRGTMYVADTFSHRVVELSRSGRTLATYLAPRQGSAGRAAILPADVRRGLLMERATPQPKSPLLGWWHVFLP